MSSWNPWSAAHNAVDSVTAEACRSLYVFLSTGHIMDRYSNIAAKQCSKKRQCWPNENIRKHGGAFCLDWDTLIPKKLDGFRHLHFWTGQWFVVPHQEAPKFFKQGAHVQIVNPERPTWLKNSCESWGKLLEGQTVGYSKMLVVAFPHFCASCRGLVWPSWHEPISGEANGCFVPPGKSLTNGRILNVSESAAWGSKIQAVFFKRGSWEQIQELVRYPPPEEEVLCRVWHLVVKCGAACEHHQAWRTSLHIYVSNRINLCRVSAINSIDMQLQKHHPGDVTTSLILNPT